MAKTLVMMILNHLQWLPQLPLLLLIIFIAFLFLKHKIASFNRLNLPPSPPKLPIIGNLHQWCKLPHHSLNELSRKYGPIMHLQLGCVPVLVVSSPEAAKEVLRVNDADTSNRPRIPGARKISYDYSNIVLAPYGDYWREIRKIFMVELMTTKRAHLLRKAWEEELTPLIEFLSRNSRNPIKLDGKIFEFSEGVVSNVALGKFYGRDQFKGKNLQDMLKEGSNAVGGFAAEDFFPTWWGRGIDKLSGYSSRVEKSFRDLDGYVQMLLDKHRQSPERSGRVENKDFVDVLISLQKDSDNSHTLTDCSIKALIMDTFFAGTNTTAMTILWAMAELMKNPRVMKKVQAEIRGCVEENRMVEETDIDNLKYLKMVVKETLRLHPVSPLLFPHEAIQHCRIGGYDVFPGTRIFVNVWAIGRDPKIWESPEEFNPDRFEGKDIDFKGHNFELLPFGSGRRMCPGITMGVGSVEFALTNLLYYFDWKLPDGMKCEEMSMEEQGSGFALHRKDPLHVVPIKYNGN